MQREMLPAEVSEANARQRDAVQLKAKRSNVNQCHVKREPIQMHMRCNARSRTNPRNPGNSEIPGTGNPRKDPGEPRLGVKSAIASLSQTNGCTKQERVGKSEEGEAKIQAEGRIRKDSGRGGWREDGRRTGKEAGGLA